MSALSRDPAAAIQAGVYAALAASPQLAAAFGGAARIYDAPPANPNGASIADFPYVTLGEDHSVGQTDQAMDGTETFVTVDVWSRATSYGEAKLIGGAVRDALSAPIALAGHRVVTWTFHAAVYRREADGVTRRGIVTFRFETVPDLATAAFGP